MYASGIFAAGLIIGLSGGVVITLGALMIERAIHNCKYRDKSEEADCLRQVARAAIAVHRAHHEKTAA